MSRPKPPGARTRLTVLYWIGPDPQPGDVLRTRTGRRYRVMRLLLRRVAIGKTEVRALEVVVMATDEAAAPFRMRRRVKVFAWTWGSGRIRPPNPHRPGPFLGPKPASSYR